MNRADNRETTAPPPSVSTASNVRDASARGEGFWYRSGVIRTVSGSLIVLCVLLVLAEFAYENHHPHFDLETTFGLQCWIGFAAFIAAVAAGRMLRTFAARDEDFYDD